MTNTRHIVVKALMNSEEFLAFDAACKEEGESHSGTLRKLARGLVASRNDRRKKAKNEWPIPGQNMAMFFPGRVNFGAGARGHMRL